MEKTSEQLNAILHAKYAVLDNADVIAISPADLADATYKVLDPQFIAPALVQIAAILELRQLARAICRERQTLEEHEAEQQTSLFDFKLQKRYSARRLVREQDDDVYVKRSHLSFDERQRNIDRLSREAGAKQVHADALKAETVFLFETGKLTRDSVVTEEVQASD